MYCNLALQITSDFDSKIVGDLEQQLRELIIKILSNRVEDQEVLCMVYEMILQSVHTKMKSLISFVVNELYKLYFKLACNNIELRSDMNIARKYLTQCQKLAEKHMIFDDNSIENKLAECKEIDDERKS